jgi:hypothetical protein
MAEYFLAVGELSSSGYFKDQAWRSAWSWMEGHADAVLIYCHFDLNQMREILSAVFLQKTTLTSPFGGEPCPLFGYLCSMENADNWRELSTLKIDPEEGITHMFFYSGDRLVGDIQVEDGPNFLRLKLAPRERMHLVSAVSNIEGSRLLCDVWKVHISGRAETPSWEPL